MVVAYHNQLDWKRSIMKCQIQRWWRLSPSTDVVSQRTNCWLTTSVESHLLVYKHAKAVQMTCKILLWNSIQALEAEQQTFSTSSWMSLATAWISFRDALINHIVEEYICYHVFMKIDINILLWNLYKSLNSHPPNLPCFLGNTERHAISRDTVNRGPLNRGITALLYFDMTYYFHRMPSLFSKTPP